MSYMKTLQIDKDVIQDFEQIKIEANKLLNIPSEKSVGYNNLLILQKIKEKKSGTFVQCGVYRGWTLIPAILYCQKYGYDFKFYGLDTFNGFPIDVISNPKDDPIEFIDLLEKKLIEQKHFNKAKERTKNFKGISHLTTDYFSDVGDVLKLEDYFDDVEISFISGDFSSSLKNFNEKIDILHLDCDLYQSYLDSLNGVYENVNNGGVVIFDEYYSLQYPGARIAVNEFFSNHKSDCFEKYITEDSFERWCVVK